MSETGVSYSLRDIISAMYSNSTYVSDSDYMENRKRFIKILKVIGINNEEIELLKKNEKYVFKSEETKKFWTEVLKNYTRANYVLLRKGLFFKLNYEFISKVYEGVLQTFREANVQEEKLKEISSKLEWRFNLREKRYCYQIEEEIDKFRRLIYKMNDEEGILSDEDKLVWLQNLSLCLSQFVQDWQGIREDILRCRRHEHLFNICELDEDMLIVALKYIDALFRGVLNEDMEKGNPPFKYENMKDLQEKVLQEREIQKKEEQDKEKQEKEEQEREKQIKDFFEMQVAEKSAASPMTFNREQKKEIEETIKVEIPVAIQWITKINAEARAGLDENVLKESLEKIGKNHRSAEELLYAIMTRRGFSTYLEVIGSNKR